MRKQGIRPSRVTYTAAVVGINRRRYGSWAPKLANLARLLQTGPGTEAGALVDAKNYDGVEADDGGRGGEGGGRRGPSPGELECSIEALGDADDAGGATRLLGVMRREGFHASPRAYRSVIYACARVGLLSEAMALAKEMHSSSSSAVATQQHQLEQQQHEPLDLSLSSGDSEGGVGEIDVKQRKPPPAAVTKMASTSVAGLQTDRDGGTEAKRRKPRGVPSKGASLEEDHAEDVAAVDSDRHSNRGVVSEDEGEAEFDIAVVYNCIICNFARAATGGCSTVSHACDPRGGREPPKATVLVTAEKAVAAAAATAARRPAEASLSEGNRTSGRSSGGDVSERGAAAETAEGDGGEGLVAMLLGVADRAEGSLTEEAANGGVELSDDECSVPL